MGTTITASPALPARAEPPPRTRAGRRELIIHLVVLAGYLAAGVAETLPHGAELHGQLTPDSNANQYVWNFWWVARQVAHLHNPWVTGYLAAPAGMPLGFDTLMPLAGVVMLPVTLLFGATVSFTVLTIALPGLLCYAVYRVARLWLRSQPGAVVAGGFFGLATVLMFQDEYHLNIAAGELLLPLALEASVRLRRGGRRQHAVRLGLVLGAAVLVNQESAVLALIVTGCALLPWLLAAPARAGSTRAGPARLARFGAVALAGLVTALVASPQLIAMASQAKVSTAPVPAATVAGWDARFGVPLSTMFTPSPRLASFGFDGLASAYQWARIDEGRPTYGLTLTVLAVFGLIAAWRRGSAWWLALLWLGASALALGTSLVIGKHTYLPLATSWHGVRVSNALPFTWFVRLPGMSIFREADRLELLGLLPAALLAGAAVDWMTRHARPVIVAVVALGLLESGWASTTGLPAALPALDGPIAADHSASIVVDVPFGVNGGLPSYGAFFNPEALVLATEDGHPRAISYTSWVAPGSWAELMRHPFYRALMDVQDHHPVPAALLAAARADARRMDVGWVLIWSPVPGVNGYLRRLGWRFSYRADQVTVYRPA